MPTPLWLTGDPEADRLLTADPFALLIGMLLDQQVTMESAFAGPHKIAQRMGGLDPARVAEAAWRVRMMAFRRMQPAAPDISGAATPTYATRDDGAFRGTALD